jgi:hypothetical protein
MAYLTPCSLVDELTPMMEKAGFAETCVNFYQTARRHIPEVFQQDLVLLLTYKHVALYCHTQLYSSPTLHSYARFLRYFPY